MLLKRPSKTVLRAFFVFCVRVFCILLAWLHQAAKALKDIFSSTEEEKKSVSLEDVRAVLAEKSRRGFTEEVKEIISKHGADRLSGIDPSEYESLLSEAEVIGNA